MFLDALALTPSGRPMLAAGEVERCLLDKVNSATFCKDGGLYSCGEEGPDLHGSC